MTGREPVCWYKAGIKRVVSRPLWAIRTVQVVAACIVAVILLALVVHLPPVRRAALRRVIGVLADRFDIALRAERLDYNLLALRASLVNVTAARSGTGRLPFFTAERAAVEVPLSTLFGRIAIEQLAIDNARIAIVRQADGSTNLPQPAGGSSGEPDALPIARLRVPRLGLSVVDEVNALRLELPALAIDVGPADGSVRSNTAGRLETGGTAIPITALGGGVAFDGRTLRLTRMAIATSEGTVEGDGTLALLAGEPRVDLRLSARTDLASVRRLVPAIGDLAGTVTADGTLNGPLAEPTAAMRLHSDELTWRTLALSPADAAIEYERDSLRITQLDASTSGGRITGSGQAEFATRRANLQLSWSGIDLEALARGAALGAPRPSARATGSATLGVSGDDLRDWSLDAQTRLAAGPEGRGRLAIGGGASMRVAGGRWSVDADGVVARTPVRLDVDGQLDGQQLASSTLGGTLEVNEGELAMLLESLRDAGLIAVEPELPTGRLNARAELAGTLARPRVELTASVDDAVAAGVAGLAAHVTASGTAQELMLNGRVTQDGNEATAIGRVWPGAGRLDVRVQGTVRDPQRLLPDVAARGVATFDLQVQGPFSAVAAQGNVAVADAAYAGVPLGPLQSSVRVDQRTARIELAAPELTTRAQVDVAITGTRLATIAVQVDGAPLERLARDLAIPAPLSGTLAGQARATMPLDDWRGGTATADVSSLNAMVGELPVRLTAPVRLTYERDVVGVAGFEADVGRTRLSLEGRLPLADGASRQDTDGLRARLSGDAADVSAAVRAARLVDRDIVEVRGPLAVLVRIDGSAERPLLSGSFAATDAEVVFAGVPPIRLPELRATVTDGWIDRLTAVAEWQDARLDAQGRVPLRLFRESLPARLVDALPATDGPATLNARLTSVTPAVLTPFVPAETLSQITGAIEASLQLETTSLDVAALRGEARLDRLNLEVASLPLTQTEPTRVAFDRGLARVAAWRWTGGGATLDVQGEIGLTDQRAALLAAGQLDLRMLAPFVRAAGASLTGTAGTRISISGSLADPRIDGEATVSGGELRLRDPRVVITDVDAAALLTPTEARITRLNGSVNGGTLVGGGEIAYGAGRDLAGRLTARIGGMGLEFPEGLRSELDGDLALEFEQQAVQAGGASAVAGRVTGTVTIVRSAYREPMAVVTGILARLRTAQTVAQASPDDVASRLALDVRVVTDSDIVVDNNLARLQLGGDLRVIGTAAAPALAGRAEIREGGQLFLGSNVYTIESGILDFADPVAIVPDLTVTAHTRAGGHDIEITVSGPPADLEVNLQSMTEPGLSQADVTSLLLTGRTLQDVPAASGQVVAEQVLSYLSGDILAIASRSVGLDTIRLGGPDVSTLRRDPAAIAAEADPTSRLTFAKTVNNDFDVTYSQSLRDGDAQTWIVDYRPLARVNLRFVTDDEDLRSYEFSHELSVGGTQARRRAAARPRAPEVDVVAVDITGDAPIDTRRLREGLRLTPGDRFDFAEWQRDRDRLEEQLHRAGWLEATVAARRAEESDGIGLTYEIAAGPATSLDITGYELAEAERALLEAAWSESVFDEFLRDEAEAIVRAGLSRVGYLEPRIQTAIMPGATKVLRVVIEPGVRVSTRRVAVAAPTDEWTRLVEDWIQLQDLDAAWSAPAGLQQALTDELRGRGYLAAQVTIAAPRVESGVAVLPVTVSPGPSFHIRDLRFPGAGRLDAARLQQTAALADGAVYRPADVDAARSRVDALYRRNGFASARVVVTTTIDAAASSVGVTFTIDEGPPRVLRDLQVRGNRGIRTDVIERALALPVGEPLGDDAWVQARARLFDTGLFRRADVVVEPIEEAAAGDERPVRVVATVEEWPALRVRYGLQLSEEWPEDSTEGRDLLPGLSADVTRRTLFGRAIGIGAAVEYRRRERLARVFLNAPTLLGLPIESLFSLERSHLQFADAAFVTDLSAVAWEQRVRRGPLQLSYAYRFERDHTFETGVPDDPFLPPFDVRVNIARLNGGAVVDTRDDPTRTSRGWLLSSNLELSPISLGSDVAFVQQVAQALHFRPWRGVVFASAGRFGIISPLADQQLIPSLLFFTGGSRTVRGVEEESLGPRNVFGDPTGGRALLVMNQEARFPVYRWLGGVGFIDAGNVFAAPGDVALSRLVTSFGGGLRIDTPFALFRIDYGRTWRNTGGVRLSEWTFGIGHIF